MIFLILFLTIGLRLIALNQSLWFDESINVWYAQSTDLWFYLTKYILGDFHPPLWFLVLWVWGHLFGFDELMVRLPSVFFGVMTVLLTYLVGLNYSKKVAVIAAFFMAVAPLHIYYSQEARPYALGGLVAIFSIYFFLKFLKNSGYKNILVLGTAFGLLSYSDYPVYFLIPAIFFYLVINRRDLIGRYLISIAFGLAIFFPGLLILSQQLFQGVQTAEIVEGWKQVVGGSDLKSIILLWVKIILGRISFENNYLYGVVILTTSIIFTIPFTRFKIKDLKTNLLFYLFILPPVFGILVSFVVPIFSYFRFLYILPFFYLLIAIGVLKFNGVFQKRLIFFIGGLSLIFSLVYLGNPDFHREDWSGAIRFLDQQNSLVLFENSEVIPPYLYYSKKSLQAKPALKRIPAISIEDVNINLISVKELYVVNYLQEITDPNKQLEKELNFRGFKKDKSWDFRGVGFINFYKK